MDYVQTEEGRKPWLMGAGLGVALIAAAKLTLHLYAGRQYGYFVDELYYLACARHLDWGYVDQPPLIAAIARIARAVLGDSLSAIRLPAALAGAGTAVLTGMIVVDKVIPFPSEPRAPILTRRWRTIVDVNGTLYALDVAASYSLLQSAPAAVAPLPMGEAAEPPSQPPQARRSRRGR